MNDLQKLLFEEYKKNGYLRMWNLEGYLHLDTIEGKQIQSVYDIAELSLIATEVVEATEIIRKKAYIYKSSDLALECADIFIRLSNFATRKGINLKEAILRKHKINLKRGYLHGKTV